MQKNKQGNAQRNWQGSEDKQGLQQDAGGSWKGFTYLTSIPIHSKQGSRTDEQHPHIRPSEENRRPKKVCNTASTASKAKKEQDETEREWRNRHQCQSVHHVSIGGSHGFCVLTSQFSGPHMRAKPAGTGPLQLTVRLTPACLQHGREPEGHHERRRTSSTPGPAACTRAAAHIRSVRVVASCVCSEGNLERSSLP